MMRRVVLALTLACAGLSAAAAAEPEGSAFDRGVRLARDRRAAEAVAVFRDLARAGETAAQVNLAVMQARGEGVPQNDQEAAYWAWRARLAGEAAAIPVTDYLMARLTDTAREKLADRLDEDLSALAAQGDAQALLGRGRVAAQLRQPPRLDDAAVWFTLAAAVDVPDAALLRDAVELEMDAATRLQVQERARAAFADWCAGIPDDRRGPGCPTN